MPPKLAWRSFDVIFRRIRILKDWSSLNFFKCLFIVSLDFFMQQRISQNKLYTVAFYYLLYFWPSVYYVAHFYRGPIFANKLTVPLDIFFIFIFCNTSESDVE